MIELTEEAAITHGRSTFYKFFSSYFLDVPGKEFYQGLVDLENLKDLRDFFRGRGLRHLENFAKNPDRDTSSLKIDYTSLFVAPGPDYVVPYESYHRSQEEEPKLMGQPALEVRREYHMAGAEITIKEMPDHLGMELEFMSYLANMETKNLEHGMEEEAEKWRDAQYRFLKEHILKWIPEVCTIIERNAETDFYKGGALLLSEFISSEAEYFFTNHSE